MPFAVLRPVVPKSLPNKPLPLTEGQLKDFFRKFDCDKDGFLSKHELRLALRELGSHFPSLIGRRCFHYADEDGDGYINLDTPELGYLVGYIAKKGYTHA